MSARRTIVVVLVLVLPACALAPDNTEVVAEVEAEPAEHGVTVSFEDGKFGFNRRTIAFPAKLADLTSLFGSPPRRSERVETLFTWDELGIKAYKHSSTEGVRTLEFCYGEPERDFDPRSPFRGSIVLPDGTITATSRPTDLRAAGFLPAPGWSGATAHRIRLRASAVLVLYKDGVTGVSLSWTGFVLGEGGPPVTPDMPLFTARSRDYGFLFDEEVVEIERRGNVSVLELKSNDSGRSAFDRIMFVMGAFGELAARLGYDYFVELGDGSGKVSVVGFTNEAEPDIAKEFPHDYDPSLQYRAVWNDMVKIFLGDWPTPASSDAEAR